MQGPNPDGPANHTGSNSATCKCKVVGRVQTPITEIPSSTSSSKDKPELADSNGKQERDVL
jgi:hypothetical protein